MATDARGSNVQVFCRVRPPNDREWHGGSFHGPQVSHIRKCVSVANDNTHQTLLLHGKQAPGGPKTFTYDRVFGEDSTQEQVFDTVGRPITQACLRGYNGTIFAYGQTGSGKTYTMQGPDEHDTQSSSSKGLVPRVFDYLFQDALNSMPSEEPENADEKVESVEHSFTCSFLEIYNERVYDLLDGGSTHDAVGLQLREMGRMGVVVDGLIQEEATSPQRATEIMAAGARNRRVGQTAMNRESSRSHSVFILQIQTKESLANGVTKIRRSRFNLVDLAGSERQRSAETLGDRLKEAGSINKSLSALGNVIMGLAEQSQGKDRHVHYRDSKLTFLLKDSLGGNSKTFMIATVSPAEDSAFETLSTLKFARRAKKIRNHAIINEDTSGSVLQLQDEIRRLREQLHHPTAQTIASTPVSEAEGVTSERVRDLEDALASALDASSRLQRLNDQLEVRSDKSLELVSTLEKRILHFKLLLRLQSSRNGDERIPEADYVPPPDAIEWRLKHDDVKRRLEEVESTGGDAAKLKLLEGMLESTSKQLASVIHDKHDLLERLDKDDVPMDLSEDAQLESLNEMNQVLQDQLNKVRAADLQRQAIEHKYEMHVKELEMQLTQKSRAKEELEKQYAQIQHALLEERQKGHGIEWKKMQELEEMKRDLYQQLVQAQEQERRRVSELEHKLQCLQVEKQEEVEGVRRQVMEMEKEEKELKDQLSKTEGKMETMEKDLHARQEEEKRLNIDKTHLESRLKEREEECSNLSTAKEEMEKRLEALHLERKKELERLEHEMSNIQATKDGLEKQLDQVNTTFQQLEQDHEEERNKTRQLEADKKQVEEELRLKEQKLQDALTSKSQVEKELNGRLHELREEKDFILKERDDMQHKWTNAKEQLVEEKRHLDSALEASKSDVSSLSAQVQEKDDKIKSLTSTTCHQLEQIQAYEKQLQDDRQDFVRQKEKIEKQSQERLERVKEMETEFTALKKAKEEVETTFARDKKQLLSEKSAVEEDLEQVRLQMTSLKSQMKIKDDTISRLESESNQKTKELESERQEIEEARQNRTVEMQKLQKQVDDKSKELESIQQQSSSLSNEKKTLESTLQDTERREAKAVEEAKSHQDRLLESQQQLEQVEHQMKTLQEQYDNLQKELSCRSSDVETLEQQLSDASQAKQLLETQHQELSSTSTKELETLRSQVTCLEKEKSTAEELVESLQEQVGSLQQQVSMLETKEHSNEELRKAQDELKESKASHAEVELQLLEQTRRTNELEAQVRQLKDGPRTANVGLEKKLKLATHELEKAHALCKTQRAELERRTASDKQVEKLKEEKAEMTKKTGDVRRRLKEVEGDKVELEKKRKELETQVSSLQKENMRLGGHANNKQKIHYHAKMKEDYNRLQQEYEKLLSEHERLKKEGRVPEKENAGLDRLSRATASSAKRNFHQKSSPGSSGSDSKKRKTETKGDVGKKQRTLQSVLDA